jgi:predicted Rossmann-fold nucleotide-binding protein
LFEALTLIQTAKIKNFPVVIIGTDYWKELIDFMNKMAQRRMIAEADLSLIYATDSVDEATRTFEPKQSNRSDSNASGTGDVISPGSASAGFRTVPDARWVARRNGCAGD